MKLIYVSYSKCLFLSDTEFQIDIRDAFLFYTVPATYRHFPVDTALPSHEHVLGLTGTPESGTELIDQDRRETRVSHLGFSSGFTIPAVRLHNRTRFAGKIQRAVNQRDCVRSAFYDWRGISGSAR